MRWSNKWTQCCVEKAMAPHSSTLARKIPWTEEPGSLQSMGSLGVGHDWATSLSLFTFMHWRRKWQPTPVFLPGTGEPDGLPSLGSHRIGHDWSDLAASAAAVLCRWFCPTVLGFTTSQPFSCSWLPGEEGGDGSCLLDFHMYAFINSVHPQVALAVKNLPASAGDMRWGFHLWVGKIPCRRVWKPTPVFLPVEFHGQRPSWATVHGVTQSGTWLKQLSTCTHTQCKVV